MLNRVVQRFKTHGPDQRGFSLLELLFALVIVAGVLAIAIPRINRGMELHMKSSARKLSSNIRYAYHQAIITNQYFRMVFSMNQGTKPDSYWIEVSDRPFFIRSTEETEEFQRDLDYLNDEQKKQRLAQEATFTKIEAYLSEEEKLPVGVQFKDVFVSHQDNPQEGGMAYLYFFPNGFTEKAVINLTDIDGNFYGLEVYPLTGKVLSVREYINYEDDSLFTSDDS